MPDNEKGKNYLLSLNIAHSTKTVSSKLTGTCPTNKVKKYLPINKHFWFASQFLFFY